MSDESKYKSYLTRLGKAVAFRYAMENEAQQIGDRTLRNMMISRGELPSHIDAAWAKKVLSDKTMFEPVGEGFWKIKWDNVESEAGPTIPSPWEGIRPGEDVVGASIAMAKQLISEVDRPDWQSRWLRHPSWNPVHARMVKCLSYAKSRGLQKPLADIQEASLALACVDSDGGVQTIALWMLDTRMRAEAYARLRAHARGEGVALLDGEPDAYCEPVSIPLFGDTPEPTVPMAIAILGQTLSLRGIIERKKKEDE